MNDSIRASLVAWQVLLLILLLSVFGGALYFRLTQAELAELDADLLDTALRVSSHLESTSGDDISDSAQRTLPVNNATAPEADAPSAATHDDPARLPISPADFRGLASRFDDMNPYCVVFDADGALLWCLQCPDGITAKASARSHAAQKFRSRSGFREVFADGPDGLVLLVGASMQRQVEYSRLLLFQILLTSLAVVAIGVVSVWVLSARITAPIERMTRMATGISDQSLGERIDEQEIHYELRDLAHVLNEMFGRLQESFERQRRFTADASHELRTPLAIINAQAELTLNRKRSSREYCDALEVCVDASHRMRSIVERLLAIARIQNQTSADQFETVDLADIAGQAVRYVNHAAEESGITIHLELTPAFVAGDSEMLVDVVTNLLTNGIRYNQPGGQVVVSVACEGDDVVLQVADTGIGIAAGQCDDVFTPFHRVDPSRTRSSGGSGLGLAICREIVDAHGGTILVDSVEHVGSTFEIRLPAQMPAVTDEPVAV